MKTLLTILTLVLSLQANAEGPSYNLFYSAASDSHTVGPLCPDDMVCVTDGTVINLNYTVDCTERIISFSYDAIEKDGQLHVYVSTVKGTNGKKQDFSCLSFSQVDKQITLINQYGDVVLHHLGVVSLAN